jgi:hypothetical protein
MILNSRANSFYFVFPKGFFPPDVESKYFAYIKGQSFPYDTLTQFMNSTIQSISFPSLQIDSVTQTRPLGKTITYQSATPVQNLFSQGVQVTFRMGEGFINYFVMMETILAHLNFKNPALFVDNLPLRIMDNQGNIITSIIFKGMTLASLSELSLNYTQNAPAATTFSVGFNYNYISIDLEMAR